jgi:transcriptional regulator with XRE-family HTH domain
MALWKESKEVKPEREDKRELKSSDAEREEELNVDILRQRVRARAAEDPDAAAFGWVARVGAALRRARDARGLTQTVLSDGTNITQGYLSSLETGKLVRGPTVDVLYRYAAALACDCEITLRDKQTGEVVTTVRSEPIEPAAVPAATGGFFAELADKMRT